MAKQLKIGFDKVPAPVTEQFPQLQDIEGNLLYDTAGQPLLTEEKGELTGFSRAINSTSLFVNNNPNEKSGLAGTVPVEEQFPDVSPVATSLLGVPRAEEQLSLFSDVSTYGIDEENWVRYNFSNHGVYPREWYERKNPVYGNRTETKFVEETNEQALYLRAFPTQFGFSPSPRWRNSGGDPNPEPSDTHRLYMNFIAVGKYLFKLYNSVEGFSEYAARNFIDNTIKIIDRNDNEVEITTTSFVYDSEQTILSPSIKNKDRFYTVDYGLESETENAFAKVEAWTMVFQQILAETFEFAPLIDDRGDDLIPSDDRNAIRVFLRSSCQPGGSTNIERFGLIESKQAFRYQPGRISGFTFGVRMKTPGERSSDVIEWGAANETDEYIFQLRGIDWTIIRRSTIPLRKELLERQGLDETDQRLVYPTQLKNDEEIQRDGNQSGTHWETKIPRDKWNGDNLLGGGRSRYTITFENVTMYKIEFSWYGAIGAKFYAFVPVESGEARWVLLHTLVIENGMDQPVLKNPDLKFKYLLYNTDTEFVTSPSFIYKYGSSYYIDGGDEGTVRLSSFTGDTKEFNERTPIVGLLPKNKILNSTNEELDNNKRIYPEKLSINSTAAARIDIETINGSPFGGHFFYSPSLHNGDSTNSQTITLQISPNGRSITKYDEDGNQVDWTLAEDESKIIADGMYGVYAKVDENDLTQARLYRRQGGSYVLDQGNMSDRVRLRNGTSFNPLPTEAEFSAGVNSPKAFTAKLTGYNSLAAATNEITANRFKIHFLNPVSVEYGVFKDFFVALTDKVPEETTDEDGKTLLRFRYIDDEGVTVSEEFDKDKEFFVEWTSDGIQRDLKDNERSEDDRPYGIRLEVDRRLPNPQGANSGRISCVKGEIVTNDFDVSSIALATENDPLLENVDLEPSAAVDNGWYKLVFSGGVPSPNVLNGSGNSEVGFFDTGTGVFYASRLIEDQENDILYCYITGDPSTNVAGKDLEDITAVQTKTFTLTSDWQLQGYTEEGTQRFGSHRWSVSRGTKFNLQPLHLVFGMHDGAKINNIYIEEIFQDNVVTSTPSYLFTQDGYDGGPSIQEVTVAGESNVNNPAAFVSDKRLSGIRFDSSLTQPLRPGTNVYSFYVGANQPTTIDLSKVFNFDRRTLTTGLVNNTAYYITATGELQDQEQPDGTFETVRVGGRIEASLTVKEQ